MPRPRYDLVCLGCGPAGEKAATQAAYFKHRVAIVEVAANPGGAMVNTGTLPSKALRETALLLSSFRRRPIPGVEISISHGVSIPKLMARTLALQQIEHDRIEQSVERHGIDVFRGRGTILNPHTIQVTGPFGDITCLETEFILLATGSVPTNPRELGFVHPRLVDADGILTLPEIPKSLLIVGGGVIGCEYASIFAEIGVKVTLVEPRPIILPFLDDEIRDVLLRSMEEIDVTIRTGVKVVGIRDVRNNAAIAVEFDDQSVAEFDRVFYAAGRRGNTRDLGLEALGITPNDRGYLTVDSHYRTTCLSLYAAGDVIGFPALASTSMEQGRVAACHMFNIDYKKEVSSVLPIGLYTIPSISMVGLTLREAQAKRIDAMAGRANFSLNARGRLLDQTNGSTTGMLKIVFEYPSRRVLGVQIIGDEATELIHLGQLLLTNANQHPDLGRLDHFVHAVFNYPTLSEVYRYAAVNGLQKIAIREGRTDQLASRAAVA